MTPVSVRQKRPMPPSGFLIARTLNSLGLPFSFLGSPDLFTEKISFEHVRRAFEFMQRDALTRFLVLTNYAERLEEFAPALPWPPNIWMGVTIETAEHRRRIECLQRTGAAFKFVSFEPLVGSVGTPNLDGIDWVIIGGETGTKARPTAYRWVEDIFCSCTTNWSGGLDIPIYFRGWGEWISHRLLPQLPPYKTEVKIIQTHANDEIEVMLRVGKKKSGRACPCAEHHPQFPKLPKTLV